MCSSKNQEHYLCVEFSKPADIVAYSASNHVKQCSFSFLPCYLQTTFHFVAAWFLMTSIYRRCLQDCHDLYFAVDILALALNLAVAIAVS